MDLKCLKSRRGEGARQGYRNVIILQGKRAVQPLPVLVGDLEKIASRPKDRVLAKLISYLRNRQRCNLEAHEFRDAPYSVTQLVVYSVENTSTHREPCGDAKGGQATSKHEEIPSRQAEADRPFLHVATLREARIRRPEWCEGACGRLADRSSFEADR